jgi:hypothetical protein
LLNVALPTGKKFDGIDLVTVINHRAPPKSHVVGRRGIRTAEYKCLFKAPYKVLFGEPPPEPHALSGQLYDMVADPGETTNLFRSKPEVVAGMLERYRSGLTAAFQRFQAARSSEQPRSPFAISAQHMVTDVALPKASTRQLPDGWSRLGRGTGSVIVAHNSDEPLSVEFPLPNGSYKLTLKMQGHAIVEVDNQQRELTTGPIVEFGEINVTDEVFRATIRPLGTRVALSFFGFNPHAAGSEDPEAAEKRLQRLRSLGYIED